MTGSSILWFFGMPSAGKTTLARALHSRLQINGRRAITLDGDEVRSGLCADLGFSDAERGENLRRAAEVAKLLAPQVDIVICAFVTPKRHHRALLREILGARLFLVHVQCSIEICIERDVKGLYAKARTEPGLMITGVQDEFEPGLEADLTVRSGALTIELCTEQIWAAMAEAGMLM